MENIKSWVEAASEQSECGKIYAHVSVKTFPARPERTGGKSNDRLRVTSMVVAPAVRMILLKLGPAVPAAFRVTVIVWFTGTLVALFAGLVAVTLNGVLKLKLSGEATKKYKIQNSRFRLFFVSFVVSCDNRVCF